MQKYLIAFNTSPPKKKKNSRCLIGIEQVNIKSALFKFLFLHNISASPRDNPKKINTCFN